MNEMSLFSRYYDMKKHAAVKEQKTLDASVKVNSHVEDCFTVFALINAHPFISAP